MTDRFLITHRYMPEKRLNHLPDLLLALMKNRLEYEFKMEGKDDAGEEKEQFQLLATKFCEQHNQGWWSMMLESAAYDANGNDPHPGNPAVGVWIFFNAYFEFKEDMERFIKDLLVPLKLSN